MKHKISPILQLIMVLAWYALLFLVSSVDSNTDLTQLKENLQLINYLKLGQAFSVLIVFVLPVVLFILFLRQEKMQFLKLYKTPPLILVIIAGSICILSLPIVGALQNWNSTMHLPEGFASIEIWMKNKEKIAAEITSAFLIDKSTLGLIINLVVIAIMAAVSEEIFFRGLIQRLFSENNMNVHLAVWLTAALFSAFHIQFFGFFPRLYLGVILGYLYAFSGNLWVSIVAHFANNAFAVLMSYFYGMDTENALPGNLGDELSEPVIFGSLLVGVFQIYMVKKLTEKKYGG